MAERPVQGDQVNEVRIGKAAAKRKTPWRWDVTHYQMVEGVRAGVFDSRRHLYADWGYTRTKLGALIQIARHLKRIGVTR